MLFFLNNKENVEIYFCCFENGILFVADREFERVLTANTVGLTKGLHNASIAANLMDTPYLLINEPLCRENPERSRQHDDGALTDERRMSRRIRERARERTVDGDGTGGRGGREGREKDRSLVTTFARREAIRSAFQRHKLRFRSWPASARDVLNCLRHSKW